MLFLAIGCLSVLQVPLNLFYHSCQTKTNIGPYICFNFLFLSCPFLFRWYKSTKSKASKTNIQKEQTSTEIQTLTNTQKCIQKHTSCTHMIMYKHAKTPKHPHTHTHTHTFLHKHTQIHTNTLVCKQTQTFTMHTNIHK